MMPLPVSIVIVSRARPDALKRCLLGVSQLQYPTFEVVIIADPAGIGAAKEMDFGRYLKCILFDEPNISAARNMGILHAAGEIVAFIDDDAVPEPTWLYHLCAPALQSDAAAMGGFVRGRNGISFQHKARRVGQDGHAEPIEVSLTQATVLTPLAGNAIKTEGTNMAVRRDVLVKLGGFDTAFRFFLDETDLNIRLARAGLRTAIAPLAEVHHGFAASAYRRADRTPRDLFEIGASWAVFQRKHIVANQHAAHWKHVMQGERRRLISHMVAGRLEPRDVRRLMKRLVIGYKEGLARDLRAVPLAAHAATPFLAFPNAKRESVVVASRPFGATAARLSAEAAARNGSIVTLMIFSLTALYHRVQFTSAGIWEQSGGLFGRSDRSQKLFRLFRFRQRLADERKRVAAQRSLDG